ncbi:MAG TPA: plastocyanin/azurin family copper-binding protein [Ktedonobacteraceae bacterium]|nr:plastocyanin/azurin family copper-binding protein [Ktedonobacteraceae bacterium]
MSGNRFNSSSLKRVAQFGMVLLSLFVLLVACSNNGGTTTPTVAAPTATGTASSVGNGGSTPTAIPTPSGSTAAVSILSPGGYSFAFNPETLTVSSGTTVIWTNRTNTPHTITSFDGTTFNSGLNDPIEAGFTFRFKFTKPGTYKYRCTLHPTMTATIIVT